MKIKTTANVAMAVIVALATIDFDPSFARGRGGGGGGMRGGGGASLGGGGGARGGGIRSSGPTSISSVGGARPRGVAGAIGNTGTGVGSGKLADAGNRPSQISSNRGNNNRINTGDVNINNGSGNGWGGYVDHPVAAGVVAGAVVGATAAAVGSTYYDVPAGCPPYSSGGYTYYSCGGAYYQPQYQGDTVVYTTVPAP